MCSKKLELTATRLCPLSYTYLWSTHQKLLFEIQLGKLKKCYRIGRCQTAENRYLVYCPKTCQVHNRMVNHNKYHLDTMICMDYKQVYLSLQQSPMISLQVMALGWSDTSNRNFLQIVELQ